MANELYQFMSEQSLAILVRQLLTKANTRIDDRIVQVLNENSSNKQSLSAQALYELLSTLDMSKVDISDRILANKELLDTHAATAATLGQGDVEQDAKLSTLETGVADIGSIINALTHLTVQTITGSIDTITDPNPDVLYFQRDDEEDDTWMLYIYQPSTVEGEAGTWVNIGDTKIDLSNLIWSKDDTEELRELLNVHESEAITDDEIAAIVDEAFEEDVVDYRMEPVGTPTIPDVIEYGTLLSEVELRGTMMYDDEEVPGTFTWTTTDEEFAEMVENVEFVE